MNETIIKYVLEYRYIYDTGEQWWDAWKSFNTEAEAMQGIARFHRIYPKYDVRIVKTEQAPLISEVVHIVKAPEEDVEEDLPAAWSQ